MNNYKLKNNLGRSLVFSHDPDSRTLSGTNAKEVSMSVEHWDGDGSIYGTQYVYCPDPLGSTHDMAAMLASIGWILTDDLVALLPPQIPLPDGAVA